MRPGERGTAVERSGLPAEPEGLPHRSVARALDLDLEAVGRHHGEETVGVGAAERRGRGQERARRARERAPGQHARDAGQGSEGHEENGRPEHAGPAAGGGRRRRDLRRGPLEPPAERGRAAGAQGVVVETRRAQHEREQVEEAVVPGRGDHELERRDHGRRGQAQRARAEEPERCGQLREEREGGPGGKEAVGQLGGERARPRREGLRPEVEPERAEIAPGRIARQQLHEAGEQHQLDEQEAQAVDPDGGPRTREERAEERALEEQRVPLVREEDVADRGERQIRGPGPEERDAGRPAGQHEERAGEPAGADHVQRGVGAREPEPGRELPHGGREAELLARRREELAGGRDAARAHEAQELHVERGEGDRKDRAEAAQHEGARPLEGAGPARHALHERCVVEERPEAERRALRSARGHRRYVTAGAGSIAQPPFLAFPGPRVGRVDGASWPRAV